MKQFSIEEYLKNPDRKVVTRNGLPVRIICTDRKHKRPIIALIKEKDGTENIYTYNKQGGFWMNNECSDLDLMFAPIKKEGWVNVYRHQDLEYPSCVCIYPTYEEAVSHGKIQEGYVTTTKIEWEGINYGENYL